MKTREDIKGIICAMVTPMHADESVDLEGVRRQTRRQIEAGVHGVFCLGTNGEGYILSHKEKLEVAQAMIDENAGRLPVYVGTGCVSTRETVELSTAKPRTHGAGAFLCAFFFHERVAVKRNCFQLPVVLGGVVAEDVHFERTELQIDGRPDDVEMEWRPPLKFRQNMHERQTVFAAADADEHPVAFRQHAETPCRDSSVTADFLENF